MANLGSIALLADLDGILPVDKPANLAAHDVVKAVKTRFNLVKVGHGGTLPPNATGLFNVLIGNATRLAAGLMGADAEYEAVLRLGRVTNTDDADGAVLSETDAASVTRDAFDAALRDFRGDIFQRAPAFNVVKMPHHATYDILPVPDDERPERLVHVYRFTVTDFAPPRVAFTVAGTKGLSVRSLVRDLGQALGCGASLDSLRRVKMDGRSVADAVPFMDLLKADAVAFKSFVRPLSGVGLT